MANKINKYKHMKPYTPQATIRREAAQIAKEKIIELLKINEEQYCTMQFAGGLSYLALLIANEVIEQELQRSKIFWQWWKNQWLIRDELFLYAATLSMYEVTPNGDIGFVSGYKAPSIASYALLNCPAILVENYIPNGAVMQAAYAEMIGKVIDNA